MSWEDWQVGVSDGIGAPVTPTVRVTLLAWSNTETLPFPLMRWFNPLNTTQKWPGSFDSGARPGPRDVQVYRSLADGIAATVYTLVTPVPGVLPNGYDAIVASLQSAIHPPDWSAAARSQLHTWGTGDSWLNSVTGGDMATLDDIQTHLNNQDANTIVLFKALFGNPNGPPAGTTTKGYFADILDQLTAIRSAVGVGGNLTPAQAQQLTDTLTAAQQTLAALKAGLRAP